MNIKEAHIIFVILAPCTRLFYFFASHKNAFTGIKWILGQNSLNHDKTWQFFMLYKTKLLHTTRNFVLWSEIAFMWTNFAPQNHQNFSCPQQIWCMKRKARRCIFDFIIFFDASQIEILAHHRCLRTHIKFSFEIRGRVIAAALSKSQNETLCEMLNWRRNTFVFKVEKGWWDLNLTLPVIIILLSKYYCSISFTHFLLIWY